MTFEHNGKTFELWLLDTNVLSEMLKNPTGEFKQVLLRSLDKMALLGVSMWTLLELRQRPDLYRLFRQYFNGIPFAILKSPYHLLSSEAECYPRPERVDPVIYAFSPLKQREESNLTYVLDTLFRDPRTKEAERNWNSGWKEQGLKAMLSHKKNFKPKGNRYTINDGKKFVELGVLQFVAFYEPKLARRLKGDIDVRAFPSVRMCFWTVFCRHYIDQRPAEPQDAFDIFISGVTPYVDAVYTERLQAEIIRKTKQHDSIVDQVDAFTLRDLRGC